MILSPKSLEKAVVVKSLNNNIVFAQMGAFHFERNLKSLLNCSLQSIFRVYLNILWFFGLVIYLSVIISPLKKQQVFRKEHGSETSRPLRKTDGQTGSEGSFTSNNKVAQC